MERKNRWFLACLAALLLLGGCQPSEENTEDPTPQQQEETKGPEQDGTSTEGPVVEEEGDVSENVASVLEVMLTGPNEKLYDPDMVTIVGLGEDMTEEEMQKKEEAEQQAQANWQQAIGSYIAEDRLDGLLAGGLSGFLAQADDQPMAMKSAVLEKRETFETYAYENVAVTYQLGEEEKQARLEFRYRTEDGLITDVTVLS